MSTASKTNQFSHQQGMSLYLMSVFLSLLRWLALFVWSVTAFLQHFSNPGSIKALYIYCLVFIHSFSLWYLSIHRFTQSQRCQLCKATARSFTCYLVWLIFSTEGTYSCVCLVWQCLSQLVTGLGQTSVGSRADLGQYWNHDYSMLFLSLKTWNFAFLSNTKNNNDTQNGQKENVPI